MQKITLNVPGAGDASGTCVSPVNTALHSQQAAIPFPKKDISHIPLDPPVPTIACISSFDGNILLTDRKSFLIIDTVDYESDELEADFAALSHEETASC